MEKKWLEQHVQSVLKASVVDGAAARATNRWEDPAFCAANPWWMCLTDRDRVTVMRLEQQRPGQPLCVDLSQNPIRESYSKKKNKAIADDDAELAHLARNKAQIKEIINCIAPEGKVHW